MNPADLLPSAMRRQTASMAVIEREVAAAFGLTPDDLYRSGRKLWTTWPRQVAMHAMRTLTKATVQVIGKRFYKHHSTVLYAERRVQAMMDSYPKLKSEILALHNKIENENRDTGKSTLARRSADLPEGEFTCIRNGIRSTSEL